MHKPIFWITYNVINLLDHNKALLFPDLICIFAVYIILDGFDTWLLEVLGGNLYEIGDCGLRADQLIKS